MIPALELSVQHSIDTHQLLANKTEPVICALSGGADSVALLTALTTLGYNCVAAHCNFHLRGDESMRDQYHAESVAQKLGIRFFLKNVDVESYRQTHNASVEMACRELRYKWFHELKDSMGAQAIAVAHNYTDNVETAILNLMRGSGIDGLRGMKLRTDSGIIRPLLMTRREDIENYIFAKGLKYVIDSTNLTTDFQRNKVRHIILPAIAQTTPNGINGITQTIHHVDEQASLYHHMITETITQHMDSEGGLILKCITNHPFASLLLYEWLKPLGFTKQQAENVINSCNTSGAIFKTSSAILINDHGILRQVDNAPLEKKEFPFHITKHSIEEFNPQKDSRIAYFDASILNEPQKLECRYWQDGDTLAPFGMKGTRKLSDIFTDAKLSLDQKSRVPLLVLGDTILWVGGIRASRHFPVTPQSKQFIKVELI
ncbi:MAG: tRNA lysidine(34) synthetase TilS [Paramuribaculum sp.]|nr:tRNA lysidine(34) synthetase TilS [Paramuribaculum sp.]